MFDSAIVFIIIEKPFSIKIKTGDSSHLCVFALKNYASSKPGSTSNIL